MIDPHWVLEDLDPHTWRAIGRFFMPGQYIASAQPGEHGLFILHDGGRRPRVVDSATGPRSDLRLVSIGDPKSLAHELHARGEWDRVHVINKRHLARVAREAQASPRRELTLDAYYHLVYSLIWDGSDGYVSVPPHPGSWHGWTYTALRQTFARLPSPSSLGLTVVDGARVHIGLAVRTDNGRITRVTTHEGLGHFAEPAGVSGRFLDVFWSALETHLAPPAAALVCAADVFETWITAADKRHVLEAAAQRGGAFVRISREAA